MVAARGTLRASGPERAQATPPRSAPVGAAIRLIHSQGIGLPPPQATSAATEDATATNAAAAATRRTSAALYPLEQQTLQYHNF